MKKTLFIFIFSIFCSMGYGQVGRIFFSSGGGSNPNVPTSVGEPFISSGGDFGVGSRKSTGVVPGIKPTNTPKDRVILFPNPTSTEVTIIVTGDNERNFTVKTFDISGRELSVKTKNANQVLVPLNNLSAGMYLIEVLSKEGQILFNQQIIKQ